MKLLCVVLLAFIVFPDGSAAEPTEPLSAKTLRIGVIQSLSGIAAEDGTTTLNALRLAQEEINSSSELKVELIVEDDETDPKKTVTAYQKLKQQKVEAIIGPTWSFTVNSILPLAGRDRIVVVNTSTIPECLELDSAQGYGFTTATSVSEHVHTFARYLSKKPAKTAIIFHTNNSWGLAHLHAFKEIIGDHKITTLDTIESVNFDQNDWKSLLPKLKAKNADLWLLLLNKADIDTVVRRAKEIHVNAQLFGSYHIADNLRIRKEASVFNGVCFPYPGQQSLSDQRFLNAYRIHFQEEPKVFSDSSYDALYLLHRAKMNSTRDKTELKSALQSITMPGLVGNYSFREKQSFSIGRAVLMCVTNGEAKLVE